MRVTAHQKPNLPHQGATRAGRHRLGTGKARRDRDLCVCNVLTREQLPRGHAFFFKKQIWRKYRKIFVSKKGFVIFVCLYFHTVPKLFKTLKRKVALKASRQNALDNRSSCSTGDFNTVPGGCHTPPTPSPAEQGQNQTGRDTDQIH